jgi:protein TonB
MIQRTYSELNMDMLVFENRNQSYGAFELRKVYNSHIRNSLLIAIFFLAGAFGALYLANKYNCTSNLDIPICTFPPYIIEPEDISKMRYPLAKSLVQTISPPVLVENIKYKPVDELVTEIVPISNTPIDIPIESTEALTGVGGTTGIGEGTQPVSSIIEIPSNDVVDFVEVMPAFAGGDAELKNFILKNTVYPNKMIAEGISGKVYVSFVIEKDGSISMIQIYKSVSEELDAEAIRVISKMPSWTPGMQNGNPVRVKRIIPISFSLTF